MIPEGEFVKKHQIWSGDFCDFVKQIACKVGDFSKSVIKKKMLQKAGGRGGVFAWVDF